MCGISGIMQFNGRAPDPAQVARMMDTMVPRGPDGDGLVARGATVLGHRRLKIIDLSEAAQQPMVDADLGLTIVYNGAIYNYPELRTELEGKGYRFFSHGDTEVIIKAFHAWGADCVKRLNGMFAFAILERDSGRITLARDRLGIKPLYYTKDASCLRFASTLPALLAAGGVDTSLDPVALNHYMTFHSVVPPERTILNGVKKLPPATVAIVDPDGKMTQRPYWDIQYGAREEEKNFSQSDWEDATLDVMRRAVKRRLVADVPVGVLLSGGLDSSLIVGLLAEHSSQQIETFSIGFESVGGESGDEFKYSDVIARHFQTSHHQLPIDSTRALPALKSCIAQMSEPMVSHDNVGFYLLSQEVAKFVKVVQSGQGADEIFGGYHWYPPMMSATDPLASYAQAFFDRDYTEYCEVVEKKWQQGDFAREFVKEHFERPGADAAIDKAMRLDAQVMLVDDPVKRVDNNTMAASLEARVPFLDHEVVEFAARVPPELKIKDGGKYVLKEAARRVIPAEVIDRPKGYFPVPALKYLRGEFLELARDALCNDTARSRGLFQPAYVDKLLASPEDHITPLRGSKLWQLSLLELWLQSHGIG
ncbi:N-acetylglutaminylglutamine amidotransferase [Ruficoccus amylovorans]|uniref:asparagine synthase (glutamine-hydrolyzing) n=1 Tax=Ruficoccus amylovorans TaxID=1804625 RepID=A0A842HD23_9BACT|nr:N-acetylglutaminylglutamine amidotransferase [Ruficoccus amylovorans]MBC2593596.1 N-acetylglutaminylglutamine amidotransferase [Ruficoccus amylovorans]